MRGRRGGGLAGLLILALTIGIAGPARASDSGYTPSTWQGVVTGAPVPGEGLPPAAMPAPPVPLPAEYDVDATYEGQAQCDPTPKPGAQRLADLIKGTYGADQTVWIPRNCSIGGQSEHKEGRALDWMTSVRKAQQRANAETFLNWLMGPDQAGRPYGNAIRLGVMYVAWNDRLWRAYDLNKGWTEMKGCFSRQDTGSDTVCHRDHIHISLTWDGATGTNSFWDGSAQTAGYCDRNTSGATTPNPQPGGDMVPVTAVRVLDTTIGQGVDVRCRLQQDRWSGDSHRLFPKVVGVGGIPASGVTGVRVRVVAKQSNAPSNLRVWSPGMSKSEIVARVGINGDAGGEATVPVASDGTIALATSAGATDVIVDVLGYFTATASGPAPVPAPADSAAPSAPKPPLEPEPTDFFPIGSEVGYESTAQGPLQPGEERTVALAGVPANATNALVFVTSKEASKRGSVRISRVDDKNAAAKFTFPKSKMHKAVMIVPVSGGQVTLTTSKKSAVHLRVEVLGYGTAALPPKATAMSPRDMFTTRLTAGQPMMVDAAGKFGLPPKSKLKGVLLRVKTKKATANGTVSLYASDGQAPATRSAPVMAGQMYAAMVLVPVGADGRMALSSNVDVKVNATVVGYVR